MVDKIRVEIIPTAGKTKKKKFVREHNKFIYHTGGLGQGDKAIAPTFRPQDVLRYGIFRKEKVLWIEGSPTCIKIPEGDASVPSIALVKRIAGSKIIKTLGEEAKQNPILILNMIIGVLNFIVLLRGFGIIAI